jgi:hypothetical protein
MIANPLTSQIQNKRTPNHPAASQPLFWGIKENHVIFKLKDWGEGR